VGHRRRSGLALAALLLLLLLAPAASAGEVQAKVASVRGKKVYLELSKPVELRLGTRVVVKAGQGAEEVRTAVVAVSTKYLVVDVGDATLTPGQTVTLSGDALSVATKEPPPAPAPDSAEVKVGRQQPSAQEYQKTKPPARELVAFRRVARGGPEAPPGPARTGPPAPAGDEGDEAPLDEPRSNEVSGEVEVGIDYVNDDGVDRSRSTPFARFGLEVDRLGGSDRTRLLFYGSLRQPIDGDWDLTGRNKDELIADITALAIEVDARPEEEVQSFTDRIELKFGRTIVPGVVEAGLIDGAELGVRFGSLTPFFYGGAGSSPNPERTDYDTVVFGGGLRFERSFTHAGALRLSVAGGQQRFRGEGERDFIEGQLDARYEAFSLRGAVVVDFYDATDDKREVRLTSGFLRAGFQANAHVRLEVGWSERRQQFQTAFIRDLEPQALAATHPHQVRSTYDTVIVLTGGSFDATLRGMVYEGGRSAYGGGVTLGKNDTFVRDRLSLDLLLNHRRRGGGYRDHSSDPYIALGYTIYGELVTVGLSVFYRATLPDDTGDERIGGRTSVDVRLPRGFGVRLWGEVDFRETDGDRGEAFMLGAALRWSF
jgi:hypothetical protein